MKQQLPSIRAFLLHEQAQCIPSSMCFPGGSSSDPTFRISGKYLPIHFFQENVQTPKFHMSASSQSNVNPYDQSPQDKFIPLLKWLSEAFTSTVHYFFEHKYIYLNRILPFPKREVIRFSKRQLIDVIDQYKEHIKMVMKPDDIFKLLQHAFQFYKKPNMKTVQKINLDAFYSVGYRSFFPPYEPFEKELREMKKF
jgi:hypothetical protein